MPGGLRSALQTRGSWWTRRAGSLARSPPVAWSVGLPDLAARVLATGVPTLTSVDTGRLFECGRTIDVFTERLDDDEPLAAIQRGWRERKAVTLDTL